MARVTVEDCLENVANRFELVIAASQRARAIHNGAERLVACKNKEVVTSLREIASGQIALRDRYVSKRGVSASDREVAAGAAAQ